MKKWLMAASLVAAAGLVLFILLSPNHSAAPSFQINDLKGKIINNTHLMGKVTLLNFWFPSCPGCVSEMPKLIKTAQDYQGKDFQIIGIAVPIDPLSSVENYVSTRQLPFTVVFDADRNITPLFIKTELYPTSVLINKRGEILKTFVGEPNFAQLYQEIDAELAK